MPDHRLNSPSQESDPEGDHLRRPLGFASPVALGVHALAAAYCEYARQSNSLFNPVNRS
jgi:hypothetical protein